ncbi:MAG TPA: DUF488 family protein [Rhodanobacteraceae bacterium]|nr:DUF488 family protein [Rhodanobacteraceae bacterium]
MIKLKRAYEKASKDDGFRILVDRLWPRGVSKVDAHIDAWLKDVTPSPKLRTWFGHDPEKWAEFRRRYTAELKQDSAAVAELRDLVAEKRNVTFVYGAKDAEHTHAIVLKAFVERSSPARASAKTPAKKKSPRKAAKKSTKRPRSAHRKAAPRRSR